MKNTQTPIETLPETAIDCRAKHTPSWYASNGSGGQGIIADEKTGRTVAVTYDEQDAPLIAAAPDLLAALERMIDNEPCTLDHHGNCQTHRLGNPCEMAQARAAIAKAKGGAQ